MGAPPSSLYVETLTTFVKVQVRICELEYMISQKSFSILVSLMETAGGRCRRRDNRRRTPRPQLARTRISQSRSSVGGCSSAGCMASDRRAFEPVAGAQQARQRLARLGEGAEQRVEAEAAFVVAGGVLLFRGGA